MKNFLLSFLNISIFKKADFIWMIHPLSMYDVVGRYRFLRLLPTKLVVALLKIIPPIILSEVENIEGFDGTQKRGYILGCFITTEMMHNNKQLVRKKVLKAAKITKKLDSKILVIGGTISVDSDTENKINKDYSIALSNGASTMTVVMEKRIKEIIADLNLGYNNIKIAIVNAVSSKGYLVSKLFSEYDFGEVSLFDYKYDKLKELKMYISREVNISNDLDKLSNADFIIIAPSYKKINFEKKHFKDGVIIYDVDDPHYNFDDISKERKIKVYNNGFININNINYNYNLGIPKNLAYTCLAEAFLLGMANDNSMNYYNHITIDEIKKIKEYFNKSNFSLTK